MDSTFMYFGDRASSNSSRAILDLEELDWEFYREKYGDIHRLDRILKAEGKSPDNYKLAKQADLCS
jgi:trehalose/maltose hydrolase-like predicted phosphorylase